MDKKIFTKTAADTITGLPCHRFNSNSNVTLRELLVHNTQNDNT